MTKPLLLLLASFVLACLAALALLTGEPEPAANDSSITRFFCARDGPDEVSHHTSAEGTEGLWVLHG